MIYEAQFGDNVIFEEGITSSTKIGQAEDVIAFSDDISSHRSYVSLDDRVTFLDAVVVDGGGIHIVTLTDSLTFSEYLTPRPLTVFEDFLYIYDWLEIPNGELDDTLTFVDEMTCTGGPGISDVVTFEDGLNYNFIGNLVSQDTLTFSDGGFSGFVNNWRTVVVPIAEERP